MHSSIADRQGKQLLGNFNHLIQLILALLLGRCESLLETEKRNWKQSDGHERETMYSVNSPTRSHGVVTHPHSLNDGITHASRARSSQLTPPCRWRCQTHPVRRRCKMCAWSFQPRDDCNWTVLTEFISACLITARTVGAESPGGQA